MWWIGEEEKQDKKEDVRRVNWPLFRWHQHEGTKRRRRIKREKQRWPWWNGGRNTTSWLVGGRSLPTSPSPPPPTSSSAWRHRCYATSPLAFGASTKLGAAFPMNPCCVCLYSIYCYMPPFLCVMLYPLLHPQHSFMLYLMLIGWRRATGALAQRAGTAVTLLETIVLQLLLLLSTDQMGPVMLNRNMFEKKMQ